MRHEVELRLRHDGRWNSELARDLELLFGSPFDENDPQDGHDQVGSSLIVEDLMILDRHPLIEERDHVRICEKTGTAAEHFKFSREVLAPGARFLLKLEWHIPERPEAHRSRFMLLTALTLLERRGGEDAGLERSFLAVGSRLRRGFGQINRKSNDAWQWQHFDLTSRQGFRDWLLFRNLQPKNGGDLSQLSGVLARELGTQTAIDGIVPAWKQANFAVFQSVPVIPARDLLQLELTLEILHSLLIRGPGQPRQAAKRQGVSSSTASSNPGSDAAHVKRTNHIPGTAIAPIVPASSLVGVMRHRARAILNTLQPVDFKVDDRDEKPIKEWLLTALFGDEPQQARYEAPKATSGKKIAQSTLHAGWLWVDEAVVTGSTELRHTRVRIDPWTGGALDQFLFSEDALYGGKFTLRVRLRPIISPTTGLHRWEPVCGLLLLVLRDLWEGTLPIGGESSIGRGILRGIQGSLWIGSGSNQGRRGVMEKHNLRVIPIEENYVENHATVQCADKNSDEEQVQMNATDQTISAWVALLADVLCPKSEKEPSHG